MDVNMTTKVVSFGTGKVLDSGQTSFILDTEAINDAYGEDRSTFAPEEKVWILAYLDPKFTYRDCKGSSGSIVDKGVITRSVTEQVQIPVLHNEAEGNSPTLQYVPTSTVSFSWYGNEVLIHMEDDVIQALSGDVPAIGEASYDTRPLQFEFTPPDLTLKEDETWPVLVVIYVDED